MRFNLPPSKVAVLDAISDRAHRELVDRYEEETNALQTVGLARSGPGSGQLMRQRDAQLLKSMDEQARVIVDAAMERWRLWVTGVSLVVALLLALGGVLLFAFGERQLASALWGAVAMMLGIEKAVGVFKGLRG